MWPLCWIPLECDWNTERKLWATMFTECTCNMSLLEKPVYYSIINSYFEFPPPFPLIEHFIWLIAIFCIFFFIFSFFYFCIIRCLRNVQNNLICQIFTVQWYGFFSLLQSVPINFKFKFYGHDVSKITIATGGNISKGVTIYCIFRGGKELKKSLKKKYYKSSLHYMIYDFTSNGWLLQTFANISLTWQWFHCWSLDKKWIRGYEFPVYSFNY